MGIVQGRISGAPRPYLRKKNPALKFYCILITIDSILSASFEKYRVEGAFTLPFYGFNPHN